MQDYDTLLGTRVRVTIDDRVIVEGTLLAYGDMGSIVVLDDADETMHCWPALKVEAVTGEVKTTWVTGNRADD